MVTEAGVSYSDPAFTIAPNPAYERAIQANRDKKGQTPLEDLELELHRQSLLENVMKDIGIPNVPSVDTPIGEQPDGPRTRLGLRPHQPYQTQKIQLKA